MQYKTTKYSWSVYTHDDGGGIIVLQAIPHYTSAPETIGLTQMKWLGQLLYFGLSEKYVILTMWGQSKADYD